MLLVIVYVGAVAVLFLFVVMMLDIDFAELRSGFTKNLPFGIIIALVLLAEMIFAVSAWRAGPALSGAAPPRSDAAEHRGLGQVLYSRFLYPVRDRRPDPAGGDDRRDRAHSPQARRPSHAERFAARSTAGPTRPSSSPSRPSARASSYDHACPLS